MKKMIDVKKSNRKIVRAETRKALATRKTACCMERGGATKRRWRRINRLSKSVNNDWIGDTNSIEEIEEI